MNKFEFKNLTPFKWFVLKNFPFLEADYDALTNWQLYCKLGKEINKIIDSQNIVGEQAENLTNAFNNLKNYVDNYFDNLDEEIGRVNNVINLLETDISKIKEEQTTQNENISTNADEITNLKNENAYLQNVVKQAFTETSASGTELTINNTIEARMEMKLNGNTSQNGEPTPATPQDIEVVTGNNTINIINSNIYNLTKNVTKTDYGFINNTASPELNNIKLKKGIKYLIFLQLKSKPTTDTTFTISFQDSSIEFKHIQNYELNKTYTIEYTSPKDNYLYFHIWGNANNDIFEFRLWINVNEAQEFEFYNTQSFPISLGSLELCKIGDYQDYFYKSGSIWYLHKEINKITSYNGETITTSYISTTGELSTGAKVYYVVTPTDTKITDTTLISQLNALYNAYTYNDTTNITQTNANLPFYLDVIALTK